MSGRCYVFVFQCVFDSAKFKLLFLFSFFPPKYEFKDMTDTIKHIGQHTS